MNISRGKVSLFSRSLINKLNTVQIEPKPVYFVMLLSLEYESESEARKGYIFFMIYLTCKSGQSVSISRALINKVFTVQFNL